MNVNECFELGYIAKTHGLKGELMVVLDVDNPQKYSGLDSFFVQLQGQLIPYFMEHYNLQGGRAIVKLEEVDSLDAAKNLVGSKLYLPLDNLPKLRKGQFYYHQVLGYQIVDAQKGPLGTVSAIYDMPGNDLLAMDYQGREVLIPMNGGIMGHADHAAKTLLVHLPEGLLEVYMNDDEGQRDDD